VTIAPETGTDRSRRRLGKPIPNADILQAVETARRCGIQRLKMYFIVGIPDETDDDVAGIATLLAEASSLITSGGAPGSPAGTLQATIGVLIPKPYTPYHREAMIGRAQWRRRVRIVEEGLKGQRVELRLASYRESLWQAYLSRGDISALPLLELAAAGVGLGQLLSEHRQQIEEVALRRAAGQPPWHFIASAPQQRAATSSV
jgi:radical SAM superfamily enzyme YgiQ (UPF0313 family)